METKRLITVDFICVFRHSEPDNLLIGKVSHSLHITVFVSGAKKWYYRSEIICYLICW
jgi:hypothetical protein